MRKAFCLLVLSLVFLFSHGQTITIEEILTYEPGELVFGEDVNDFNGNPCAMVIVDIPFVENMIFKGNIVGEVEFDEGEYYIYVPQNTKRIKYLHEDYYPGCITFDTPVKSSYIYRASLLPDNLQISDENTWLVLDVRDAESHPLNRCKVLVDDEEFYTDDKGTLELFLDRGTHDYSVCQLGYADYNQSVTLSDMPVHCSPIMVRTSNGDVICSSEISNGKTAFSKKQAQKDAWFLTDKMGYELNLTDLQKQDVYEINYDYLCNVQPVGTESEAAYNLRYRNLSLVLDENQLMQYQATPYFLIPLESIDGEWELSSYSAYSRDYMFDKMTKTMSKYDGKNATSAHYYQARGLGYRDDVSHYVASNKSNKSEYRPFSRLVTKDASSSKQNMTFAQRQNPTHTLERNQRRQEKSVQQKQYRAARDSHRKDRAEVRRTNAGQKTNAVQENRDKQGAVSRQASVSRSSQGEVRSGSDYTRHPSVQRNDSKRQSSSTSSSRTSQYESRRHSTQTSANSSNRSTSTSSRSNSSGISNSNRNSSSSSSSGISNRSSSRSSSSSSSSRNSSTSRSSSSSRVLSGNGSYKSSSSTRSGSGNRGSSSSSRGGRR